MLSYVWASPAAPVACVSCQSYLGGNLGLCAQEVLISLAFGCRISQGWQVSSRASPGLIIEQLYSNCVLYMHTPGCGHVVSSVGLRTTGQKVSLQVGSVDLGLYMWGSKSPAVKKQWHLTICVIESAKQLYLQYRAQRDRGSVAWPRSCSKSGREKGLGLLSADSQGSPSPRYRFKHGAHWF